MTLDSRTKLSVNVNKVATLRNARGHDMPNVLQVAMDCELFGAQGITVHPRPDERHIRKADVYALKGNVLTELNIEGYPSEVFINMVLDVKPHQVTLVPDAPDAITSDHGWDCVKHQRMLSEVIDVFQKAGIRTSVFLDPEDDQVHAALQTGTDRIELYTESFASHYHIDRNKSIAPYASASKVANEIGLGLNAGHDLNLQNLRFFAAGVSNLKEVSIGHALICDALYYGLQNVIQMYLHQLDLAYRERY
jgi:pyridoxine 5-phosphate synthase